MIRNAEDLYKSESYENVKALVIVGFMADTRPLLALTSLLEELVSFIEHCDNVQAAPFISLVFGLQQHSIMLIPNLNECNSKTDRLPKQYQQAVHWDLTVALDS